MAGSFNHIIDDDGGFRPHLIENMRDAREALEECFNIIAILSGGDMDKVRRACSVLWYPEPKTQEIHLTFTDSRR